MFCYAQDAMAQWRFKWSREEKGSHADIAVLILLWVQVMLYIVAD